MMMMIAFKGRSGACIMRIGLSLSFSHWSQNHESAIELLLYQDAWLVTDKCSLILKCMFYIAAKVDFGYHCWASGLGISYALKE